MEGGQVSGKGERLRRRVAKFARETTPERAPGALGETAQVDPASPFMAADEGVDFVCERGHPAFTVGRFRRRPDGEWVCVAGDSGRTAFNNSAPDGHTKVVLACGAQGCTVRTRKAWPTLEKSLSALVVLRPRVVSVVPLEVL